MSRVIRPKNATDAFTKDRFADSVSVCPVSEAYQISNDRHLTHDLCIKTMRPLHDSALLQP